MILNLLGERPREPKKTGRVIALRLPDGAARRPYQNMPLQGCRADGAAEAK